MKAKRKPSTRRPADKQTPRIGAQLITGILAAFVYTALCILVAALLFKYLNLPDGSFGPINVVVKMTAVMLCAAVTTRRLTANAWAYGAIAGVLYIIVGYLTLSVIEKSFGTLAILIGDVVMGAIVGFATGILIRLLPQKKTAKR
jgi:putative membrane protein (TIGR04086 family)